MLRTTDQLMLFREPTQWLKAAMGYGLEWKDLSMSYETLSA